MEVVFGVYWVCMVLLFVFDYINLWFIDDGDGWMFVDIGILSEQMWEDWELVFDNYLEGRFIMCVIVIYFYFDYIGLVGWIIRKFGCQFWML